MKNKKIYLICLLSTISITLLKAQNISSEIIDFQLLQQPKYIIDANSRNFKVTVTSPYNLTADDVIRKAKEDHQKALNNYNKTVSDSEIEFQQKIKDYESELLKAKDKFALESAEFKKLSMLERLSMTEQGLNPKLVIPTKPVYVKPAPPIYSDPNLNNYAIMDNNVLASLIAVDGFSRGTGFLDINVDIKSVSFQDNAGQTFANQPTKLIVKVNGVEKSNNIFFQDYTFLSSSPSNNINKPLEEKNHLNKVITFLNQHLNYNYGFPLVKKSVKIQSVKNKGEYDDLTKADIYVTTNLKKLQSDNSINTISFTNMQKGIDIWVQTLGKIDYKNSKAIYNAKIAEFIYFNLIRLNIALGKKMEAEKYLNQLQENLVYIKLTYDRQRELELAEKEIYALAN